VNDIRLDPAGAQPTSQPKPVAASFKGDDDALDYLACLNRLITPAMEKP
jgi:hypothetical protein